MTRKGSQEWYTPEELVKQARYILGEDLLILDPCSTPEANKTVRADVIYTKDDDGLSKNWRESGCDSVFLNPPGVVPGLARNFLTKAYLSGLSTFYVGFSSIQLQWASGMLDAIHFPAKRLRFSPGDGQKVTSPSVYCFLAALNLTNEQSARFDETYQDVWYPHKHVIMVWGDK